MANGLWTIEARSLDLGELPDYGGIDLIPLGGHNFWVLRDGDGRILSEIHGLAYDRDIRQTVPIGYDSNTFSLRVFELPVEANYATSIGVTPTKYYSDPGQDTRVVLSSSEDVVLERWNAARNAMPYLNSLDLDYPVAGVFDTTIINSNSAFRTLGEIMRLPIIDFLDVVEPGLDNRMIPSDMIKTFQHLNDIYDLNEGEFYTALIMANIDGTAVVEDAMGNSIKIACLENDFMVFNFQEQSNTNNITENTLFFNTQGILLGNLASFDPENALSIFDSLSSDSDLLEFFQTQMTLNFIDTAGIYSSAFNRDASVFDQYSVYSLDNKYYDTWNFSIDNIDELPQVQYDPDTMTITPEMYNPTPNYTANDNLFSNLYIGYSDGTISANVTFQPYENWASFNGISIGGSFSGDGYSFHIGFSWSFPVVLDLDGDGVELTSVLDSNAWFDIKGDGVKHQTGWVGADDGLLAYDENGDGLITTGREIAFADRTTANDTDLEAIRSEFDSNNDGKLDANDSDFDKFKIWQDKDSDGVSDDGELFTLEELGIKSVNLMSMDVGSYMVDGNKVNAFTTFTRTDDSVGLGGDVALAYDNSGYTTSVADGYMTIKQTGNDDIYALATNSTSATINLVDSDLAGAFGNDGNDTLDANGKETTVILEGGIGDDVLKGGSGDDWLDGGAGADTISGGKGNDTIIFDNDDNLTTLKGGEGLDTLIYRGTTKDLNINMGVLEVEAAYLGDGNDTIAGSYYSDILAGGVGNDTLRGSFGNDIYVYNKGDGNDIISDYIMGSKQIPVFMADGGTMWVTVPTYENAGEDTILFGEGISIYDLQITNIVDPSLGGSGYTTEISIGNNDKIIIKNVASLQKIENLTFADGSTYKLQGLIIGTEGNDNLVGDDNSNNIEGSAGADIMSGGAGDDTYYVDNDGDTVTEGVNKGTDTVQSSITYTLGANVENLTLTGTSDINGTGTALDNILTGNNANNILDGGAGNDTLDGRGGIDTLKGGIGNDIYIIDNIGDIVTENYNEGIDQINSSVSYTISSNVENLTLIGNSAISGIGNELNNTIVGNSVNNTLDGKEGVDTLKGGDGDDIIYGGDGNDLLYGENGNDILNGGLGSDTLNGGIGIDTVTYENSTVGVTVNLALTTAQTIQGTEKDTITGVENLTGSDYNDILKGSTLSNTINGLDGDDIIMAGTGKTDDIFDGGDGIDTISYEQAVAGVTVNLSTTTIQNTIGSGNDTVAGFENLTGSKYNDTLNGDSNNNIILGGAGVDTMNGGAGDDTYYVDNVGDIVYESLNEGIDTVNSSITYTLGANIENLTLTSTSSINATGNTLNNIIIGNSGANIIDGSAGADIMSGGVGNDTYAVDDIGDIITELINEGTDTIKSSIAYTLGANIENLTLIGSDATDATGNELNNIIIGNDANNILNGGLGNDTLNGSIGIDTVTYENSTVGVSVNLALTTAQTIQGTEKDTIIGVENLIGSDYNDILKGSTLSNTINGLDGDDIIMAGTGKTDDIFDGGDGIDTISYEQAVAGVTVNLSTTTIQNTIGSGNDTVAGFENLTGSKYNDTLNGDSNNNIILGGAGIDTMNGGAGDDTLDGGAGNDILNGGDGSDIFIFNAAVSTTNSDTIVDFNYGEDIIYLNNSIFTALGADGILNEDFFKDITPVNGETVYRDSNDYLLYNRDTGNLFYDSDGYGGRYGAQLVAHFDAFDGLYPIINTSCFVVI